MRILITNDDGIEAPGLAVLHDIATEIAGSADNVFTVAPAYEQSGVAHCISYTDPMKIARFSDNKFSIEGSPADCVMAGLYEVLAEPDGASAMRQVILPAAAGVDVNKIRFAPPDAMLEGEESDILQAHSDCVVLIGASTGGPQAIMEILPKLPADLPAGVVIVQHMPPNFTRYFAERLDCRTKLSVKEADEGDLISQGNILVAPGGLQLFLDEHFTRPVVMLLSRNEKHRSNCPSIDFALSSFAPVFREKLVAVILTGMGKDGSAGCRAVKETGGTVLCQDEETSLIFGMPGTVIQEGLADEVVSLDRLASRIADKVMKIQGKEKVHEGK